MHAQDAVTLRFIATPSERRWFISLPDVKSLGLKEGLRQVEAAQTVFEVALTSSIMCN